MRWRDRKIHGAFFALLFSWFLAGKPAVPAAPPQDTPVLSDEFYKTLQAAHILQRDIYLDGQLNKILTGRGQVDSLTESPRYRRRFKITVTGASAGNIKIIYSLYTDEDDFLKVLHKNDLFEFRGQFVIYTPLSSRRDSYIFDVLLEDGAIVVD